MACGSGCCSPPQAVPALQPEINEESEKPCKSTTSNNISVECEDVCCDTGSILSQGEEIPTCCEGKSSPCCNFKCIERIALRECEADVDHSPIHSLEDAANKAHRPCSRHVHSARDKYLTTLESLGCICRSLLAHGQQTCCSSQALLLKNQASTSRLSSASCTSLNSCCATNQSTCEIQSLPADRCASETKFKTACADACCSGKSAEKAPSPPIDQCSTTIEAATCDDACCKDKPRCEEDCCNTNGNIQCGEVKATAGCAKSCCSEKKQAKEDIDEVLLYTKDPELGLSGKEHIILSISGMTCTGCETKLSRTLATLPAVSKLQTSLVLSRAEFDLNVGVTSAVDVMKHLERTTEFKCERITNQGSSIDFLCPGNIDGIVKGNWPEGVLEIKTLDKSIIQVDFDAKVVGARDLADRGWHTPMSLAPLRADPTLHTGARHVKHVGYMTLLSIVLTIPVLVLSWAPIPEKGQKEVLFGSISLALASIIQLVIAGPFYPKALKALIFSRVIEMDLLIVLSTSAAYIFSVVAFGYMVLHEPLSTGEFFETSTLLVTLIMVGRYIAALARQKAVESISIRSLQSSTATIIDNDGTEKDIDARLLQFGDQFKVFPDSRIPTDGTVVHGFSEVDESMLTGESLPVVKQKGSAVIAGSMNGSGTLLVRLSRVPGDNTISTIAAMVDEAKLSKPKVQEIADQVASYFVPVVVSITIVVFSIWIAIGITVQGKSGSDATVQAITYAITVLIVSCPCAIGLAVPMVVVVASGVAADRGVIFKSANAIEVAHKASHVAFDKTGTLTEGKLTVIREEYLSTSSSTKSLLLGLISTSKHPVSVAVAAHLRSAGVAATSVSDPKSLVGKGLEGSFAGRKLCAGNSRWLGLSHDPTVDSILKEGHTAFCFTIDGSIAMVFGLGDILRPDASSTVARLVASNISVHIVSGDDDGAVRKVASQLNIPGSNVRSRCTPADKQAYIQNLLNEPNEGLKVSKPPVVMFCGDGTNDAVALAQSTIGVHINEGTDVAQSAADIVLMRPSLAGVLIAIDVSKKAIHRIGFNFGWSFVYNVFAILLAAGAFVHARIPPEFAGLGELVSVLPVVAAGVTLKWAKL